MSKAYVNGREVEVISAGMYGMTAVRFIDTGAVCRVASNSIVVKFEN